MKLLLLEYARNGKVTRGKNLETVALFGPKWKFDFGHQEKGNQDSSYRNAATAAAAATITAAATTTATAAATTTATTTQVL